MRTIEEIATEAITEGIEVLNAVKPDWVDSIPEDLAEFDFMDAHRCPLYWVFGGFFRGLNALVDAGFTPWGKGFGWVSSEHAETDENLAIVNNEWRKRITELREMRRLQNVLTPKV